MTNGYLFRKRYVEPVLFLISFALIFIISNPTQARFEHWAARELQRDESLRGFGKQLVIAGKYEKVLKKKNYLLFSVYYAQAADSYSTKKFHVVGILNRYYPVDVEQSLIKQQVQ
ncbi:hypothetical protein [Peribacillus kribbensis]|uniref:hypothetical protein n=1 Tax=Peribacillus kribbensis TaxID=356658 RepID=UPI00041D9504|nr:hypothetical protein [Peribacillus kribbensis]